MEIRFFAPGSLVSNLDFVESIFGNAGDPFLPENDAGLDPDHWTGHTGCVVLAPHLTAVRKKDVGLPSWEAATERQRRDGMCWREPDDRYNGGKPFKITARDGAGQGNLLPYLVVQAGAVAAVPLLLVGRPREARPRAPWLAALALYVVAKALEDHDRAVFLAVGVSGHTLKHLVAAGAIGVLALELRRRAGTA